MTVQELVEKLLPFAQQFPDTPVEYLTFLNTDDEGTETYCSNEISFVTVGDKEGVYLSAVDVTSLLEET